MNSAEQTVTWLITLGVLESPKKTISDPEGFLQSSLKDGVVLCKLLERLRPGCIDKIYQEPRNDTECLANIREFLKGCGIFRIETFEANDLFQGQNFSKVLNSLVALSNVTADIGVGSDSVCAHHSSSHRIKSFDSLGSQSSIGRSSKLLQNQYRSLDMSENSNHQMVVKARFNFQQTNEDELSFNKGDIIHVTRTEDGGWWEGSFSGKTGWFPSNYVREVKGSDKPVSPKSGTLKSPPKGFDTSAISKTYYTLVLQNILETETEYSKELQNLLSNYLRSLQSTEKLSMSDIAHLLGNLEEISTFQQMLVQSLEECTKLPEAQQRVGGFFLSLMPQMKGLYVAYCANHPSAVSILTEHSEELGEFMEGKGASSPGILTLTTGLSKPFMRLDKYPTLLKELERHMEEYHPDRPDIQKCMTSFKNLSARCQEVRKRKELELQILTESIRCWEGDDIKSLGSVLYMSQVLVHNHGNEEKSERYLLLFPHVLLMLSTSPRMSGFVYQGKLPLTGMTISKLEDTESYKNAFEISGPMIERIQVACHNQQDLQDWVDHLHRQTKRTSLATSAAKPQSVPCHTLPSHPLTPSRHSESRGTAVAPAYHTLPHLSSHGTPHSTMMWGPLEPPKTQKPWSLSCLRPAPPLKPSAALCFKEDLSKSPKSMKKLLPKRKPERKPSEEEFALRKSTAALEEDAQILKVIEAYCTSAKTRQTLNSTWQGTDLMHNHVLADDDLSSMDSPVRRNSISRPEPTSDLSEDSDYDIIWTAHSNRMVSSSRSWKESGPHMLFPEEEKIIVEGTNSNGQTVIEEKSLVDTVYALKDEVQELRQDNKKMKRTLEEEQRARKELEKMVRRVLKTMNDPSWDQTNL
ncbi:rho guanine nucleotide exchange factor 7-like isoform X1 [Anguilla anguilla]|uniref:rho guanine nucleotide exchange factor 7-like isoform X1 n=1 Tax=Anguilla anguilla TaxID=7936 RepID=UPI0015B2AE9D|nr:rho guanine nucleotide exchange factor 7-like isoform X1 [Anguilla anguilla]